MPRARVETSAGGVLFRCTDDGPLYLLILDSYGNWGFAKGHVDEGETPEDTARREVREETALDDLVLHGPLGTIDWHFRLRGELIHKYCHYSLFEAPSGDPSPQLEEGISACEWYPGDAALATITYENARGILQEVVHRVSDLCARRKPA